jgi:hypothetical protein
LVEWTRYVVGKISPGINVDASDAAERTTAEEVGVAMPWMGREAFVALGICFSPDP